MKVKRLHLENFRGFKDATFEFSDRVNVLVGVNGAGKTTLLHALEVSVTYVVSLSFPEGAPVRLFTDSDMHFNKDTISISLSIEFLNNTSEIHISKKAQGKITSQQPEHIYKNNRELLLAEISNKKISRLPLITCYLSDRFVLNVSLKTNESASQDIISLYLRMLTPEKPTTLFQPFFEWFRNREDLENENLRYTTSDFKPDNWEYPDRQLEAVRRAITSLMPEFSDVQVRRNPLRMAVKKHGKEFRIEQLSDGEKCLLAMVGDLARRLAIANPGLDDPLQGEGVVLIDEIELHLHPKWQRMIIPKLLETFPGCQFIVSTHSPQVLSEVEPENIFLLHQDEETGEITCSKPTQSYGLDSNEILEELMGARSRNKNVEDSLRQISILIDEDRFQEARIEINALKEKLHGSIPDLVEAESMITSLEN